MPLGSLTSSLGSSLSSIVGGLTAGNNQPVTTSTQARSLIDDVSKDRFDLTSNSDEAKEPELPVAGYGPPATTAPMPPQAVSEVTATGSARGTDAAPPPTPTAARPVTTGTTGTTAAASGAKGLDATTTGTTAAGASTSADMLSLWSDEEQARALAMKALDQERRMNVASDLSSTDEAHVVALTKKADAQATAQTAESKRPALLVA